MMEQMVDRREAERRKYKNKKLQSKDFTKDEKRLMAVTGALAKAMKAAIDTPMLKNDGSSGLTEEAESGFADMKAQLPAFKEKVSIVEAAEPEGGYGSQKVLLEGEEKDPLYLVKSAFGQKRTKSVKSAASTASAQPQGKRRTLRNAVLWMCCVWVGLTAILSVTIFPDPFGYTVCYVIWAVILCPKVAPERPVWKRILMMIGASFLLEAFR